MKAVSILLLGLFFISQLSAQNYEEKELPSGRKVKISGIRIVTTQTDSALMLKYYTDIPKEKGKDLTAEAKKKLGEEADEIFEVFKHNVEQANQENGLIQALWITNKLGPIQKTESFVFGYKKDSSGLWKRQN